MKKGFYIFIVLIFLQIGMVRGQGNILGSTSKSDGYANFLAFMLVTTTNLSLEIKHTARLINGRKSKYPVFSYIAGGTSIMLGSAFLISKNPDIIGHGIIDISMGLTTITLALLDKYSRPHLYGWNVYIVPPLGNGTGLGLGFVKRL